MMKFKSIKLSTLFIVLSFFLAISVSAVFFIANDASANEESEVIADPKPCISLKVTPENTPDSCYTSSIQSFDLPIEFLDYTVTTTPAGASGLLMQATWQGEKAQVARVVAPTPSARTLGYKFEGFYYNGQAMKESGQVPLGAEIEVRFSAGHKALQLRIGDFETQNPLEGYKVTFYDKNKNKGPVMETDVSGSCIFEVTDDYLDGYFVGDGRDLGYTDILDGIYSSYFDDKYVFQILFLPSKLENATLKVISNNAKHDHFMFKYDSHSYASIEADFKDCYENPQLQSNPLNIKVNNDGTIELSVFKYERKYTYKGVSVDGSPVDSWKIKYDANEEVELTPGEDITFENGLNSLVFDPVYGEAPQPGPGPEPTPTPSEEVNATAQTGDSTAALPLAILAIAAGVVVFVARRKASKIF